MPHRCTAFTHASRDDIDRTLMSGVPPRKMAAESDLSPSAPCRHTRRLETLYHRNNQKFRRDILDKADLLEVHLNCMVHEATYTHSLRIALDCIRKSIRVLTLMEKFCGRLLE